MEPCETGVMSAMMSGSESAGDVSCGSKAALTPLKRDFCCYPATDIGRPRRHVGFVPIASFWTALRQVRSTLQRRHEATDGSNRIRKRRTFDPGCSSPWVSSAAASGAPKAKWMTKCSWLAFAEGGGEAWVCDGDRAGASVTRPHHAVKHERC